jgi:tetraacyldisaccharide-1-P 4'-kinase
MQAFRDHHKYSRADVARLEQNARQAGAQALVTTEKDEENLRGLNFALPVFVVVIDLVFSAESEFGPALDRILKQRRSGAL